MFVERYPRNSRHENTFGLRLLCEPSEDYADEILDVLADEADNFPFEFYAIKFMTFGGHPVNPYFVGDFRQHTSRTFC
ncbi:MAG: hypothetical protein QM749_13225 [Aquabacterium sp.]